MALHARRLLLGMPWRELVLQLVIDQPIERGLGIPDVGEGRGVLPDQAQRGEAVAVLGLAGQNIFSRLAVLVNGVFQEPNPRPGYGLKTTGSPSPIIGEQTG